MDFELDANKSSIIKVIGVGGGGNNAVNHMYEQGIANVDFIICNTDIQALRKSPVPTRVQIGLDLTEGLGAGNQPERGENAAKESIEAINKTIDANTKMVFITAGMGGGTGTGAAPVIAKEIKERKILTIGIVTIPFRSEGPRRLKNAIAGLNELRKNVDSLLIINNEKLREIYGDQPLSKAFANADEVLATAAKGIAEIITVAGHINVDFADVKTVMENSGVAIMGTGYANGEDRAITALKDALTSPLLNNNDIKGAKNILLNITSGNAELTMDELGQITEYVQDIAGSNADLIYGTCTDSKLEDNISVTIIATGFKSELLPDINDTTAPQKTQVTLGEGNQRTIKVEDDKPQQKINFESNQSSAEKILYGDAKENNSNNEDLLSSAKQNMDYLKKHTNLNDEGNIDDLENIPAYLRQNKNKEY